MPFGPRSKISLIVVAVMAMAPATVAGAAEVKEQRFSVFCDASHTAMVDPIVAPGGASTHLHEFFGNRSTAATSTYATMVDAATSCHFSKETAAYWAPAVRTASGARVDVRSDLAYYLAVGQTKDADLTPFPRDLRIITDRYAWLCLDAQAFSAPPRCDGSPGHTASPNGVGLRYLFPQCWVGDASRFTAAERTRLGFVFNAAGQVIDSRPAASTGLPPHRLHMAFQTSSGCPAKYPEVVPRLGVNVRFGTDDGQDATRWTLDTGVAPHADFWNTWDQQALVTLIDRCIDRTEGNWATYSYREWRDRCNLVTNQDFAIGD
jgi:Domain of unknown function (DUF1996)